MTHALIVDDDTAIQTITSLSLKRDGWEVSQATAGKDALDLYAANKPDIVLLDLMMPDMDGRDVLKALQEAHGNVNAVFITARHDVDDELMALGAAGVLRKPYDPLTLGTELRAYLK